MASLPTAPSKQTVVFVAVYFAAVAITVVTISVWMSTNQITTSSAYGYYRNAAVSSDSKVCSDIGRNVLLENGSTVDAAIATLFCIGVEGLHSSGIGGGFFMVVYDRRKGSYVKEMYAYDARESAPAFAVPQAFSGQPVPLAGAMSIGIPGEVKGYYEAWSQFGRLSWRRLVQPTIDLCSNGIAVEYALSEAIASNEAVIRSSPNLRKYFVKSDGTLVRQGDRLLLPELARTMTVIADDPLQFYRGKLADDILADLREFGSNITASDMSSYAVRSYPALSMPLRSGDVFHSLRPPSSGALLGFMLRVLEGYGFTKYDLRSIDTYQKIVETFKFSFASRTFLGDETFENLTEIMRNLTSFEFADYVRSRIDVVQTHPVPYYYPAYYIPGTSMGTAQVSIVGPDGSATSATSTINSDFGSKVIGSRTGIVFNDELGAFIYPDQRYSPANAGITKFANDVSPGKRPLSSMCPAIITNSRGEVTMVIGADGGRMITPATAFVAAHALWLGLPLNLAIDELRIHHQLMPNQITPEFNFSTAVLEGLKAKGHVVTAPSTAHAVVDAIQLQCHYGRDCYLLAVSDWRKRGAPSGY